MAHLTVLRVRSASVLSILVLISLVSSLFMPLHMARAINDTKEAPFYTRTGPFDLVPATDSTGGASYSIPIATPSGRNGVQPSLSLAYSSGSADNANIFGYGFDVPIPKITRINKEGMEKLYTRTDFSSSLDGELVQLSSANYAPRYENGSFNTYTYNSGTQRWTVIDKSGTVFSFGTTAASKQDNPANTAQVYAWYLDRVEDANGNYITYTYFKDAGQVYPDKISYTGNSVTGVVSPFEVSFVREARTDSIPSYRSGFSVKSNYRVKQILVKAMGTWVRKYDLMFGVGANGARSMLASVTESGRDESGNISTLPPTLFEYQVPTIGFSQASWNLPTSLVDSAYQGDNGTRFGDVNGDGLVDIIKSKGMLPTCAERTVWLNTGSGWLQNSNFTINPTACFVLDNTPGYADFGLRLGDINGDGKDDLIHAFQEANNNNITTYKRAFVSTGSGFNLDTGVSVPNTFNFAGWFSGTTVSTPLDVNADSRTDLFIDGTSFFLAGNGATQGWATQTYPSGSASSGNNFQIAELNGDGLPDTIAWYQIIDGNGTSNYKTTTFGDGVKFVSNSLLSPTPFSDNYGIDYGVRTADINGDGLTDLVQSHQQVINYQTVVTNNLWINKGTSFQSVPITLPSDVNFSAFITNIGYRDSGWRMLDVNGDGMPDIVGSKPNLYPQSGVQYNRVYINTSTKADLLKKVTIPQGGTTTFTYKTDLQYKDGSGNLLNTGAPYPVTVVDTVTTSNGVTNDTKSYTYEGAFQYFAAYNDKQFGGFSIITETDSDGNKTKTYYHQGNTTDTARGEVSDHPSKIGRVYRTERYNASGNLMAVQINGWDAAALSGGRFLVTNGKTVTQTYEGDATHRDTATSYTYDANGNLATQTNYGEVTANNDGTFTDIGSDLRTTQYTYATDASGVVKNKVSQVQLNDNTGALVSQAQTLYDALPFGQVTKGNVTSIKKYIAPGTYATTTNTYNIEGLVTATTNPRGYTSTYAYDTYKLYPVTETNALSQVTTRAWNYALGKEKTVTDPNNQVTQTDYDGFGRITAVSATDPYTFSLTPLTQTTYFDYRNAFSDYTQKFINSNLSQDTYTYYDALGRKVQTRTSHEQNSSGANFAVSDTVYGTSNRVLKQSLPYYATGSSKSSATGTNNLYTTFTYDSLNRPLTATNTIGTTTTAYGDWSKTITDAQGNKKDIVTDAFGNIAKVNEYPVLNGAAVPTTYQYNALNLLTKITDGAGNIRNFTYGPRGERTLAEDLHNPTDATFATTANTYDVNGNVLTETRGGSTTTYAYDQLDRVTLEDSDTTALVDVAYTYDDTAQTANGKGRLTKTRRLVDASNSNWSYFYYLRNGAVYQDVKSIFNGGSYTTKYTYDTAGNVTLLTTPDNAQVKYTYNALNKVDKVERKEPTDALFSPVVFNFDYGPHGNVVYKKNANMTDTYYTYDANELYRLKNISTIDPPLDETQDEGLKTQDSSQLQEPAASTPPSPAATAPDTTTQQSIPAEQAAPEDAAVVPVENDVKTAQETDDKKADADKKDPEKTDTQQASKQDQTTPPLEEQLQKDEFVKELKQQIDETAAEKKAAEDAQKDMPVLTEDTTPPPAEEPPVFSPEGKKVAEDEHLRTENSETYVVATDGDTETRVTRLYTMPIHVKSDDGAWENPDQEFKKEGDELSIDKATYSLDVPTDATDGTLATIKVGNLTVDLSADKKADTPQSEGELVDNGKAPDTTAQITDAIAKDVNVKMTAGSNRIAKNVVIENVDALKGLTKVDDYYEIPFDLGVPKDTKLFVDGVETAESVVVDRAELRLTKENPDTHESEISSLFIMPGIARDAHGMKTGVQFAFTKSDDGFTLTKRISSDWLENAEYPVTTDAVFAPSPDISDGEIGYAANPSPTWAQMTSQTSGTWINTGSLNLSAGFNITRLFFSFDTSSIPDTAQVTNAYFKLYASGGAYYSDPNMYVTQSTRSNPQNLTLANFSSVTNTKLSDVFSGPQYPYASTISIPFNATGKAYVNLTGWTQFALRTLADVDKVSQFGYGGLTSYGFYASEDPGTTRDPYFEVTYNVVTLPARATSLTVDGQPNNTQATAQPKFSAVYNDTDDVDTAIAYQIQVIKDGGSFATPLWDSGKVSFATAVNQGARTPDITYGGTALPLDGTKYKWRMKVWDFGNFDGPWSGGTDAFTVTAPVSTQYDLQTDCISAQAGRLDPTGLKCAAPVFAAKYNGTNPVTKYRVQVSKDATFTDATKLMWDSGAAGIAMQTVTTGSRTPDIIYKGKALKYDGTRYYWHIQYADAGNMWSNWSANGTFTTFAAKVYQNLSYTYDVIGNPLSVVDASDLSNAKTTSYTYDPLSRILSATATTSDNSPLFNITYSYDTIGNLTSASDVGTYTYASTGYASPNAPTSVGSSTYTYDVKGNLINDGAKSLNYFYDNLLSSVLVSGVSTNYNYFADKSRATVSTPTLATYYANKFYNIDGAGKKVKHLYVGSEDVATVETSTAGVVTPFYNHDDALGSSAVSTSPSYNNPPEIKLSGSSNVIVPINTTFTDTGATATDPEDGAVTVTTTGSVNTAVLGSYQIVYSATDSKGYATSQVRNVAVVPASYVGSMPNPSIWWKLDGAIADPNKLVNSAGSSNNLTVTPAVISANGKTGTDTALRLQTGTVVSAAPYSPGTGDFTVAIRFKPDTETGPAYWRYLYNNQYTSADMSAGNQSRMSVYINSQGQAQCVFYDRYNSYQIIWNAAQNPVVYGQWNDLVCTRKNGSSMLTVNGVTQGGSMGVAGSAMMFTQSAYVGNSSAAASTDQFTGVIDDIRFYNRELTQNEMLNIWEDQSNKVPTLTLNGSPNMVVAQNSTFTDPGATASDAVNGASVNLSSSILASGSVNTATLGTQTITYSVTDTGTPALTTKAVRSVTVVPAHLIVPNNVQVLDYYPFGKIRTNNQTVVPGTTSDLHNEQFKAFQKIYDSSSDLYYSNARYYNQNIGQFTTPDPISLNIGLSSLTTRLLLDPQQQNAYSYARNNPLANLDPSGLYTLAVGGTNLSGGKSNNFSDKAGQTFLANYGKAFGEKVNVFQWSGQDNNKARQQAAKDLAALINTNRKAGEPLNIIAHSHAGNIVAQALVLINGDVTNLVTLGTPSREFTFDESKIANHVNVYSVYDKVQSNGGGRYRLNGSGSIFADPKSTPQQRINEMQNGEFGPASRTFPGANNIDASVDANVGPFDSHSALWQNPAVFKKYVEPNISN